MFEDCQTLKPKRLILYLYHCLLQLILPFSFYLYFYSSNNRLTSMHFCTFALFFFFALFYFHSHLKTVARNIHLVLQFIIEAVVGGKQGSIAIDNIMVSSDNGSCPAERECTFQGSLCGLKPQPSADFSWSRIMGTSQPANSSGPTADHTLGTAQGLQLLEIQSQHQI